MIFVAVSINLPNIIAEAKLVSRSAKAILTLTGVLLASSFCLVPAQSGMTLGSELTVLGVVVWVLTTLLQIRSSHREPVCEPRSEDSAWQLTQTSGIPVWVCRHLADGGSREAASTGCLARLWLVSSLALIDAWVLLIEIQR